MKMKRPVLAVCTSCRTDERWDGSTFFKALKRERKARGLKPVFKLKESGCLGGCDTPCNAELYAKGRERALRTWLHGEDDVQPLIEAVRRWAQGDAAVELPGRPAPDA